MKKLSIYLSCVLCVFMTSAFAFGKNENITKPHWMQIGQTFNTKDNMEAKGLAMYQKTGEVYLVIRNYNRDTFSVNRYDQATKRWVPTGGKEFKADFHGISINQNTGAVYIYYASNVACVAKYDPASDKWVKITGLKDYCYIGGLAINENTGEVYATARLNNARDDWVMLRFDQDLEQFSVVDDKLKECHELAINQKTGEIYATFDNRVKRTSVLMHYDQEAGTWVRMGKEFTFIQKLTMDQNTGELYGLGWLLHLGHALLIKYDRNRHIWYCYSDKEVCTDTYFINQETDDIYVFGYRRSDYSVPHLFKLDKTVNDWVDLCPLFGENCVVDHLVQEEKTGTFYALTELRDKDDSTYGYGVFSCSQNLNNQI